MGDESLILREDGCVHVLFPINSLTYHNNLNVILVRTASRVVYVLDVNSGVILESTCLSADDGGVRGIQYAPGADRVFVWDGNGVGARTDYNGVLLLQTALQRPLPTGAQQEKKIRLELVLSEALILSQCLDSIDSPSILGFTEFVNALKDAISKVPTRKGVKAQKWSTVTLKLAQSTFRYVTSGVVQELKDQNRRIPALAIASAVGQRANDLVPCTQDEEARALMYSEAERKETFKRWPHMDYKWALPARMAQAGFYHQPTPNGDDRAMCFTCLVCLVCWEKSDEPWVEHERHSPNCPFVRGEYTHNVPISVTNATSCAVASPNVAVVSRNSTSDLIASGTADGKINIWKFDTGLKLAKYIHISPYDTVFSGMVNNELFQVWPDSMEKDQLTYNVELTAMAFLGVSSACSYLYNQGEHTPEKENRTFSNKPSLICGIIISKAPDTDKAINEVDVCNKAIFESGLDKSTENVKAMNDQNEAKNISAPSRQLLLLTYDIYSPNAGSITGLATQSTNVTTKPGGSKKVYSVPRADDSNIYDEIYVHYSDDETDLVCTNLIEEQISNVINLNASSSKEDKTWDSKKLFAKHFKVLAPAPSMLVSDYSEAAMGLVNKVSQLKSWTSGMACIGTKLADQLDAAMVDDPMDPITHYLNLNGPLSISDFKCYEGHMNADSNEKVKLTDFISKLGTQPVVNNNNDSFENVPQPEEVITQGIAIQCVRLPAKLNLSEDSRVTHLIPVEDKNQLVVVISSVDVNNVNYGKNIREDQMEVDDQDSLPFYEPPAVDCKAYILVYKVFPISSLTTLEDLPLCYVELPHAESPVDLCRLPSDKFEIYNFASVGVDGNLRIYQFPTFKMLTVKLATKSPFTSVVYCTGVERLSVSTKNGHIYFYSMKSDQDSFGEDDEEHGESTNMAPGPPVLLAHKTELSTTELESLISLTGSYGTNNAVPYNAVVPGFWSELSPAQRSRFDSNHNSRMWRLQNTSSTWDEHLLELTLPYSVSLAHVDFGFTLHDPLINSRLPTIEVTLLKQNLHGIGFRSDDDNGDSPDNPMPFPSHTEEYYTVNPVNTEEYLRAHNAEILAGPLQLSSGIDMSQQSGTLILTSPRLYRAKGRTFLIHIKTLLDSKDVVKMPAESQRLQSRASFVGCDWLHQISITVRSNPHTDIVLSPKLQRITMLQSNQFLNTVLKIAASREDSERRKIALDLIIWVVSIRLQRLRLVADKDKEEVDSVEVQQLECVKIVEKYLDALVRNCILCAKRSIAKKCVKIILITSEGARQLPDPKKSTFKETLGNTVANAIPFLGACESPGAMRWMSAVAMRESSGTAGRSLLEACLKLLEKLAKCLNSRTNFYHGLLRSRFGLYGLPLERTIFEQDGPVLSKGTSTPLSLASMIAMDTTTSSNPSSATSPTKPDYQMRNLYNFSGEIDGKVAMSTVAWWSENPGVGVFSSGLSETQALHVTCHVASDGTKLESNGSRHNHNFGAMTQFCADPNSLINTLMEASNWHNQHQFWKALKDDHAKPVFVDPDSLEDGEMECEHHKMEMPEDNIFKDPNEPCLIPWSQLVSRPPLHTLLVERMHSGARRYIILDFGHVVRLSDVIIPACSDLVTLGIDIWLEGEETDSVKLAYSMDIATKHLVLSDIQPPPLCRYMKITTIGRYGMSAMKCKIPLGWFYGEVAQITNTPASVIALHALHEDLTCRFRLATGKLIDLLRPYMDLYYANVAHMMAYFNMQSEADPKVISSYQECIDIQQQLHTVSNTLKRLQSKQEFDNQLLDLVENGAISPEELLERACTDKLRVMTENVIDMLLHIFFEVGHEAYESTVTLEWCKTVSPLLWESKPRAAAGLATLLPRICGHSSWWGKHLADTLQNAFEPHDDPPKPLNRILLLSMFMARYRAGNAAPALSKRALTVLESSSHQPALIAAVLAVLSAATEHDNAFIPHERWEWVTGGRASSYFAAPSSAIPESVLTRGDCKLHRRGKLHKKLLYQMHEFEQNKRVEENHGNSRGRALGFFQTVRLGGMLGSKSGSSTPFPAQVMYRSPLIPRELACNLTQALVKYMLAADSMHYADTLMLAAKVVGSLCLSSGGPNLLDPGCILGLARLATTLPTWPRHAVTNLLQDLIESDRTGRLENTMRLPSIRPIRKANEDPTVWRPPKNRAPPVDSDESDSEDKFDSGPPEGPKRTKYVDNHTSNSNISGSVDARLETCTEALSESAARMLLLTGSEALTAAIRAPTSYVMLDPPEIDQEQMSANPLKRTLHDVFKLLATEFRSQTDCQFMEHVMALWMTLNGTNWGTSQGERATSWNTSIVISDGPKIRLSNDTVEAILKSLVDLESVTLRCWILCLQALAWIANLTVEGDESRPMGDVIMQCGHFVPAMVKFVNMNVINDGAVFSSEQYLSGVSVGAGTGTVTTLMNLLNRVASGRGPLGAGVILQIITGAWQRGANSAATHDLHSVLIRIGQSLVPALTPEHLPCALELIDTIASLSGSWVNSLCGRTVTSVPRPPDPTANDSRLSGLLADVVSSNPSPKRLPLRRAVITQLLHYAMALVSMPLDKIQQFTVPIESMTDERKQQAQRDTNVDDERKQRATKIPCLADTVLQNPLIMKKLFKALAFCDNKPPTPNPLVRPKKFPQSLMNSEQCTHEQCNEPPSLKEEVYGFVAHMSDVASQPGLIVQTLLDYIKGETSAQLSESLQHLMLRLFDKPEVLRVFIEKHGLEVAVAKLCAHHMNQLNTNRGLVSSLMNYLKLPVLLINNSTNPSAAKKNLTTTLEASAGLYNYAPLCSISCDNPTAQPPDVLLGAGANPNTAGPGPSAARRVRSAAWSYHFFSADDTTLSLMLTLPYAVQLHEIHLQPHLSSLATCPGAVAVEAGCYGTMASLGPPQNTSGMSFIRLVVASPIICTNVQLRLYKPRDSSNMGLLQVRLLGSPAFGKMSVAPASNINNWAYIVSTCISSGLTKDRWVSVTNGSTLRALAWLVLGTNPEALHASRALLGTAMHCADARESIVHSLLALDTAAHSQAFQWRCGNRGNVSMSSICELLRRLCGGCSVECAVDCTRAYIRWLSEGAQVYLKLQTPPSAALVQTLASVLWMLMDASKFNLYEMMTDNLFDLIFVWLKYVPDMSLLKKTLDSVLCSMCYIRPELFRMLLGRLEIPVAEDERSHCEMEGLTDDGKVEEGAPEEVPTERIDEEDDQVALKLLQWQLNSVAAAALSPTAVKELLRSPLLSLAARAITKFSNVKSRELKLLREQQVVPAELQDVEEPQAASNTSLLIDFAAPTMKSVCAIIDFMQPLCADRRLKDWMSKEGAIFWRPLLLLLCYPRPSESTWKEGQQFEELEESTIRLFAELTTCHETNQKLFATTLHAVLETIYSTEQTGVTGFTRALILRLLLSVEKCTVVATWTDDDTSIEAAAPGSHPMFSNAAHQIPVNTTVGSLIKEGKPAEVSAKSSPTGWPDWLGTRHGMTESCSINVPWWELSLAAGSASKDRRLKDMKNCIKAQYKKRFNKVNNDANTQTQGDAPEEPCIQVRATGINGIISPVTTIGQLSYLLPHTFGPHLILKLQRGSPNEGESSQTYWTTNAPTVNYPLLCEFGACGGLALVASRLPRPHTTATAPQTQTTAQQPQTTDSEWVKLDDFPEEVLDMCSASVEAVCPMSGVSSGSDAAVPPHALSAVSLLLKLPGYAAALLAEGSRAVQLLRLLLGVTHDEDGKPISVGASTSMGSLGTLPFGVISHLLDFSPRDTDDGRLLRRLLLNSGAIKLVLTCLAVFTHHKPPNNDNSQGSSSNGRSEDKSQLYWAKGTGFGTGSIQQSWNVEQALVRQKTEEEHVTVLMQVIASYINCKVKWPPEDISGDEFSILGAASLCEPSIDIADADAQDLPSEFIDLIANSSLVPAICSYLRNDSVLDMSRHIPLYLCVLSCARALFSLRSPRLTTLLSPLPRLLRQMSTTTNSYATKLRMNKKDILNKLTYYHKKYSAKNMEIPDEDEGLAALIADIQATSRLMIEYVGEEDPSMYISRPMTAASREARYIEVMKKLQFETFEMITECKENGFRFTVPYHFEGTVRAAGDRSHPARMKRLAQEAATLASSLPLSYSSSVFVRTDTDRLDVMKVLITGPSDTPYANGCFILDVYFPADYPSVPMLINLETTGRHSVRFNPNLYNDGKVCLSVLNTWHGRPEEKWNAHTSSFLQVLVSIQSLILVPEPYFNEPGYERSRGSRTGNNASTEYNSNIYQANVRWAMLDHLKNPEPCFKEVIQTHFWIKRNEIMQTISGWITELENQNADERTQRTISLNLVSLKRHYMKIQEELAKLPVPPGLEDLDEPFQLPAPPTTGLPAMPATPFSPPPAPHSMHTSPPATPAHLQSPTLGAAHKHMHSPPPAPPSTPPLYNLDHDMEKIVSEVLD